MTYHSYKLSQVEVNKKFQIQARSVDTLSDNLLPEPSNKKHCKSYLHFLTREKTQTNILKFTDEVSLL